MENINRIVCWFSCGAASAVATKLAIIENNNKIPIFIVRCVVKEEHEDNDRFSDDCEKWFGMPIIKLTNEKYKGSIYEVFNTRQFIAGIHGAPCTMLLKKQVRIDFQLPNDHQIFGYCSEEQNRFDNFIDANNISASSPLIERGLEHKDCLSMIEKAGIELPIMYKLGYKHNNCIGCVKSQGRGYWNKIRNDFPVQFYKMADLSKKLNVRLIKSNNERIFLDELVPDTGDYQSEPEIQCGIFCEMANKEIKYYEK